MDIAYLQIILLLVQCSIIAVLLLILFRLRTIFGLSLLLITLGVFQFIQVFLTSTLSIEIYSGYIVSPGSMVLFTGSLFAILLVYHREGALEARKIIYALFIANVIIGLLLVIFSYLIIDISLNNIYNLPVEFYSQNVKIIFVGTILLLLDGYAIVFLYEFLSKYIKWIFLKMLFTMVIVLSMDALFFAVGVFEGTEKFQTILVSGLAAKTTAAFIYSSLFTIYLIYFDNKSVEIDAADRSFTDIFRALTFRKKYEDVLKQMRIKTEELQETQDIAQIGSYVLDLKTNIFESSPIFDRISGLKEKKLKTHKNFTKIIHPNDIELNNKFFFESIRTQKEYKREYRILPNNKEIKWLVERGRAVYKNGEPILFKGTIQDITIEKFKEFTLKKQNEELNNLSKELSVKNKLSLESERKYKTLFSKSPISLWEEDFSIVKKLVDQKKSETNDFAKFLNDNPDFVNKCIANVKILNVNDVTLELLGVANKEELIAHLSKNFNVESFETFKKELIAVANNKKYFNGETQFNRSDGKVIKTLIQYVIINDDYSRAIVSIVDITELNEIKEKIEISEKKFRELFEKSSDAILIIENQIFKECNQATIDMLGYKNKEEFLHVHPSKLSPQFQPDGRDSFEKAQEMISISLKNGTHRFEWIHTKSSGEDFPVEVLLTVINNEEDNKIIHCVLRDITDRKQAELTLLENQAALKNAQKIAQLGSYNLDFKTQTFTSSDIFDALVGFKASDIKTLESWRLNVHPEDLEGNKIMLDRCIKTKEKFDREYRIIHKITKKIKWIHALGEILYQDNIPTNFIGTIQDITERKVNELAISLNEKKLIEIQKIANLGTYEIDLITNTVTASSIYKSILGIKKTPTNNKGWWKSITHPNDFERSELKWKECINNCKLYEDEYRIINDKKDIKWIYDLAEVRCENGIATKVVGTIQDITARKVVELKLKENELKLNEAQKIAKLGSFIFYDDTKSFESTDIFDEIVGITKSYKKDLKGWLKLVHEQDILEVQHLLENTSLTTVTTEFRIVRFDTKRIVWVKGMARINYDKKGVRTKVIGTLQDITQNKLSELKIKRSDTILSNINSLVQEIDKNGNITYASPSFKTLLGFEPQEMLGLGWWIKTTSNVDAAHKLRDEILNIIKNNAPLSYELKNRWVTSKDGQPKLFDWISSKGDDDSLILIGIDITEKQEKQQEFITLIETAHDAIILVNQNGEIFEWNKSSENIFGYKKEAILGKKITCLMPKKYRSQYKAGYNKVMQEALKKDYRDRMVEGITKEGIIFPMELSINFWQSNNKNVYCYFIRDITEHVREENLKSVLFNITKRSGENISLKEFFYYIKKELGKLINTNNFFIALYDDKTDMISTPFMVDEYDDGTDFPKGKTLTGHVIDTKKALLTNEKFVSYNEDGKKVIGLGPESKCWLGVPLIIEDKAIGAIVVQSYTDEKAYSEADVAILELVASNIAQLIQKTQDLEKIILLNQALIQSSHAVIITNLKGEIEYTNPAFTKLTGYTFSEVERMLPNIMKPEFLTAKEHKNLWETISDGKSWEGEFLNLDKDNKNYLIEVNISAVRNIENEITHFIIIQEDITNKRKLERQFINAFIDAQEVEKQNFGEELHDGISQILSAESMYIDLLIEQNQDRINGKARFLTKIKELNLSAVNETRNIAHGLMSSQLKQSGLLSAAKNICIDFNLVKNIKFKFLNKGVNEEELSKEIKTNLFRIIQELTTNINRYSSATMAYIEFRKLEDNKFNLTVKDNGIGMNYNKIKKERKVTGLKNVERRITFLKGTYKIKSEPNKGTCWEITVPL